MLRITSRAAASAASWAPSESGRDLIDIGPCLVDRGLADQGDSILERAVVFEQSETLAREREETAQSPGTRSN